MNNKFLAYLFAGLVLSLSSDAQPIGEQARKHLIIKLAPLALFDVDNTFQAGIEIPLKNERFSVQQDFGYGNASFNIWYKDRTNRPDKTVWKSRTQLRYYFYEKPVFRAYVSGEYLYKRVVMRDEQWAGVDCSTGGCNFYQKRQVKLGRLVNGFHAKAGWQFYLANRSVIDLFAGMGLRNRRLEILTPGVDQADFRDDFWFFTDNSPGSSVVLPSLSLGFHIGIVLGKIEKEK